VELTERRGPKKRRMSDEVKAGEKLALRTKEALRW
jgi:hypothetical protein